MARLRIARRRPNSASGNSRAAGGRRSLSTDDAGALIVEFALILPLFLLLTLGLIEMGRALWTLSTITRAAESATRWAIVRGSSSSSPATTTSIQNYARSQIVGLNQSTITVNVPTWNPARGGTVTVQVNYPFTFRYAPVPIAPFTLTGSSTMVVSN